MTGTYVWDKITKKVVKVSNTPSPSVSKDRWFEKYKINGNEDMRKCYKSFEEKGTLNKVNDKEVWKDLI